MSWDLCLKNIQIYSPMKHSDLVKTALRCWKIFCFIHISQAFGSDVAITWDLNLISDGFYSCTYYEKYVGRELMGFIILRWNVAIRKWIYRPFDENNIFMQNVSVKQHLLLAWGDIFTQEWRQRCKGSWFNLRSQISLPGLLYRWCENISWTDIEIS